MFERALELEMTRGIKMGANGVVVSHLQFADDTVIFCNNDMDEVLNINRILRGFQLMSGLKINFTKTMIRGVGLQNQLVEDMPRNIVCEVTKLPLKYFIICLGANPRKFFSWKPIIDRTERKLAVWKSLQFGRKDSYQYVEGLP